MFPSRGLCKYHWMVCFKRLCNSLKGFLKYSEWNLPYTRLHPIYINWQGKSNLNVSMIYILKFLHAIPTTLIIYLFFILTIWRGTRWLPTSHNISSLQPKSHIFLHCHRLHLQRVKKYSQDGVLFNLFIFSFRLRKSSV